MDRGLPLSVFIGLAAVAVVMAGQPPSLDGPASLPAREQAAPDSMPGDSLRPVEFRKGREILEAFFGGSIPPPPEADSIEGEPPVGRQATAFPESDREAPRPHLPAQSMDFDVILASVPDPYESRMDWIYDALLAAVQRAFETGGFVLDRYWVPNPDSVLSAQIGENTVSWPAPRLHPGVILFRSWDGERKRLRLRMVYLVGEIPTKGVHIQALRNALREREILLDRLPSAEEDSTAIRRETIRILGPVFSGSSHSYRRVLEDWLSGSTGSSRRGEMRVRLISGSATSPGNKATLEGGAPFDITFSATVNPDNVLMGALTPLVLKPLDIHPRDVAILQEYTTAYGQSLGPAATDATEGERIGGDDRAAAADSTPLVVPFPMSISLLRSEYARLPSSEEPVNLIPDISEGPRVPLSLLEGARTPETPASVSGMTAPTLDIVMEEITRVLAARGVEAVGLMATDVRDKLFLGDQIKRRLPDVQLFTLESNVLLRAPEYRDALKGMLVLSTYPLFLENQERIPGQGRDDLLSFPNDGAQGAYNAALLHLGLDSLLVGYGVPQSTCVLASSDGGTSSREAGGAAGTSPGRNSAADGSGSPSAVVTRRPPVWLSAIGNTSLLPISCTVPKDDIGYLAQVRALPEGPGTSDSSIGQPPRRSMLLQGAFLLLSLTIYLVCLLVIRDPIKRKAEELEESREGGVGQGGSTAEARWPGARDGGPGARGRRIESEEEWDIQEVSHLIHLGIYRGAFIIGLGGLAVPLGFPLGWSFGLLLVVLPAALTVCWIAGQTIRLTWAWKGRGLRMVEKGIRRSWTLLRDGEDLEKEERSREIWKGPMWGLEILARTLVAAAAISVAVLLSFYGVGIRQLGWKAPGTFDLFVQRASQWGGGISPLLPLTLGLLGMAGWCLWHWIRIEILFKVRPFEDSTFPQRDLEGCTLQGKPIPPAWQAAWEEVIRGVQDTRMRLFMLIPDQPALAFGVFMAVSGGWLLHRMGPTLERAVLNPGGVQFSAWPFLFKGFVVSAILVTGWSIYRFVSVWSSLRRVLTSVLETPLVPAFHRLPMRVARLTRLTFFERTSRTMLGSVTGTQWRQLQQTFELVRKEAGGLDELPEEVRTELEDLMQQAENEEKVFLDPDRSPEDGKRLARLRKVLTVLWCREPTETTIDKVKEVLAEEEGPNPTNTGLEIRTTFLSRAGLWVRQAEELMATQIVGYVGWALSQVRWLALFLLFSLLFTTGLVSSYPYRNQGEAKVFFFFVAVAGILALSTTVLQMNRNDLLSRINGSDPDRLTWNTRLLLNLFVFGGIPLLAVLSSAFPPLRNLLAAWMGPLMGMLGS